MDILQTLLLCEWVSKCKHYHCRTDISEPDNKFDFLAGRVDWASFLSYIYTSVRKCPQSENVGFVFQMSLLLVRSVHLKALLNL